MHTDRLKTEGLSRRVRQCSASHFEENAEVRGPHRVHWKDRPEHYSYRTTALSSVPSAGLGARALRSILEYSIAGQREARGWR